MKKLTQLVFVLSLAFCGISLTSCTTLPAPEEEEGATRTYEEIRAEKEAKDRKARQRRMHFFQRRAAARGF